MLHSNNETVRSLLLKGNFGLEKESLRITKDGNSIKKGRRSNAAAFRHFYVLTRICEIKRA